MGEQLYWEDVQEGAEITPLKKQPTPRQLVQYAGASLDFYEIHYNKEFALENNLPDILLHGALKNAWLGQLMTDWIGEGGTLRKLSCQYRRMDFVNQPLTCKGTVTKKSIEGDEHLVECDIWVENSKGEDSTPGAATVVLPSRQAPK